VVVCALTLCVASPAIAKVPTACHLLSKKLVEDYYFTDISTTTDVPTHCERTSRIVELHRSAALLLTNWALLANAKSALKSSCVGNGHKKLSLTGADAACSSQGYTGICFDKPTGRVCMWQIAITFRRGNTTGELDTVAPHGYWHNTLKFATRLADKALARWP
jgi:hypothetical protein